MPDRQGKQALYADLKRRILTLELTPGHDLDEARIGAEYGLSRTPVREIFRQLAGEGYVDMRSNRGATVSSMSHKTLRDFFLTAPPIYAAVARLAVENARPGQLEELKAAQQSFVRAVAAGEPNDTVFANNRFHLVMGEMADNAYLAPSFQRLLIDHARIGQTFYRPRDAAMQERLATASAHHDGFIAAIEAGDAQRAVALAHAHWALSRDQLELFVRPDPLPFDMDETPNDSCPAAPGDVHAHGRPS